MSSDPPELGKGLFGYRKSAVNQILSDRDLMLRQAEGRVRQAESKVGELERELNQMRTRNTRMDEQLERLRAQLDALSRRAEVSFSAEEASTAWDETPPGSGPQADTFVEEDMEQGTAAPTVAEAEEDLSYGFPTPGAEGSEPSAYEAYGSGAPEAGEDQGGPGGPESYWSASDQPSEVHMETGPDYTEPEPSVDFEVPESPEAAEGYEPPQFSYGGEQAITDRDEFTYGGEQAVSQPEEDEDEMDQPSYGGDLRSPFEPQALAEEEQEPAGFEMGVPPSYEPSDYQATDADEPGGGPAPYEPAEYRPADYEPVAVRDEPAEPPPPSASMQAAESTSRMITEEIAGVLSAAEESAARILERARVQSDQQISKSSRLWEEVRAEVARLATWRQGIEPVIQTVMTKVEGIRTQIEDVPERIREALAPMADSISGIDSDLAELAEACSPPLLLAPSELESDEAEGAADWDGSEGQEDQASGRRNAG